MKTIIISLALFVATSVGYQAKAQINIQVNNSSIELKIEELEKQKNKIEKIEKDKLRQEVEAINERLDNNEITATEAAELKKAAAEKRALNIENQLNIIDENIALLKRNTKTEEDEDGEEQQEIDSYYTSLEFLKFDGEEEDVVYDSIPKRTTSDLFFAFGLNNALIENQSLDDSPYKIGGSRFFEVGYEFETMLNNNGFMRLKYGVSFQFNGLKADDNMYFVEDGDQTVLEEFPYEVDKAKLRMDNLVVPVHFVFGPSKISYDKKRAHYNTENFKIGLGGYAGLNLSTIQKLKYKEDGRDRKDKLSQSYNTSNFIYGLSAYVGYDNIGLYVKYDLNPIFKDNPIEQNNISVGLRVGI
ncbi:hypothetical protein [Mesonia mobilis]|uniref:hypothetical protein n=1 Tax=Mesonia mobilis TaxID=369791 RepID=UPI0026E9D8AE|nr:hypothetical protein [Mesonia mobilis]